MKIKYSKGSKSSNDKVLWIKTNEWERLRYKDLFDWLAFFADMEDINYPPPRCLGREYFRKAVNQAITEGVKKD